MGGDTVSSATYVSGNSLTIEPDTSLGYSTNYTVTIPAGSVKDGADNALASTYNFSFTTGDAPDTTAPVISNTNPANGASNVEINKTITVVFNELVLQGTNFSDISVTSSLGTVYYSADISESTLTIVPTSNLDYYTTYNVIIPASAVKDAAGNQLTSQYSFSFTTEAAPDITPPNYAATYPKVINVGDNSFDLLAQTNENGKAYYVLLDDGAPAPTSAEVRAGTASGGGAALQSGYIVTTANTEATATISGLAASTNYDIYIVAEDTVPNLQGAPVKMDVNTTDTIPPAVISTDPSNLATGVAIDKVITVTFSEYIQPGSAYDVVSVRDDAFNPVDFIKAVSDNTLTFYPASSLSYSTRYTVNVPALAITDTSNNALPDDFSFSFTTEDREYPVVISTDPANSEIGVPPDKKISVVFSVYIQPGSAFDSISVKDAANVPVNIAKAISGDTLGITPDTLNNDTLYTVTIPAHSVTDYIYSDLQEDYIFSFATKDTISPAIVNTDPANKDAGVPAVKTVTVTLSENVLAGDSYNNITFTDKKDNPVTFTKNVSGNILTIDPVDSLDEITDYKVTIPAGVVKDLAGNLLEGDKTFRFTTWDKTPPAVESSEPENDAIDVHVHKTVTVTFNEEIQESSAFIGITLKDDQGNPVTVTNLIRKNKLVIIPDTRLDYDTRYIVTVPVQAVKDLADNELAGEFTLSFITKAGK